MVILDAYICVIFKKCEPCLSLCRVSVHNTTNMVRGQEVVVLGAAHWYSGDASMVPKDRTHRMNREVRDL